MANYHYDEAGNMAAYFLISILAIVLVPLTLSSVVRISTSKCLYLATCLGRADHDVVQNAAKQATRAASVLNPKFTTRTVMLLVGWLVVALLVYRARTTETDSKLYDPYEILGISTGVTEKEIKSLFKKLAKIYHPDKVKATVNETVDQIANRFVDITKAYKALTDETIRRNYETYGHPDGRQEVSMGIALPSWIIEGKNNIWVLGFYAVVFGGLLPGMVGRWWFGSKGKTKDGIEAETAEGFWKGVEEASGISDVVKVFGGAFKYETQTKKAGDLSKMEEEIAKRAGDAWKEMTKAVGSDEKAQRASALLYAHFLRLELGSKALEREQTSLLLQTPMLLNAFLNVASARSWLAPTLGIMRLHAYIVQALVPGKVNSLQAQLPGFDGTSSNSGKQDLATFVRDLGESGDDRAVEASKALENLGTLEVVDLGFKVIGERVVTPSSIVYLLVKLRVKTPGTSSTPSPVQDAKSVKRNDEIDEKFLNTRGDAEALEGNDTGYAHAPYWPGLRKPGWWLVLADDKSNRIVVPPLKIHDVPRSDPSKARNYRRYKLQFQAPPNVGLFTWKVYFVSDTVVGEETCRPISLKIDDVSTLAAEEQTPEDEISDPEEDSLAGQMAAMRGGQVKKTAAVEESDDDDDESSTDDDADGGADSSDSD
ncbi:translocation protein sec63 [Boletus reticuloceps]|uniref:Translocation protein sec63 n=1 Tax=Boletus reticuloceps TaxID=495285 RepID=A0A8I2YMN4_9AGAM|nr:translocation protein sec63 [Boletus reticuloceps]